jgi:hypothetical protein
MDKFTMTLVVAGVGVVATAYAYTGVGKKTKSTTKSNNNNKNNNTRKRTTVPAQLPVRTTVSPSVRTTVSPSVRTTVQSPSARTTVQSPPARATVSLPVRTTVSPPARAIVQSSARKPTKEQTQSHKTAPQANSEQVTKLRSLPIQRNAPPVRSTASSQKLKRENNIKYNNVKTKIADDKQKQRQNNERAHVSQQKLNKNESNTDRVVRQAANRAGVIWNESNKNSHGIKHTLQAGSSPRTTINGQDKTTNRSTVNKESQYKAVDNFNRYNDSMYWLLTHKDTIRNPAPNQSKSGITLLDKSFQITKSNGIDIDTYTVQIQCPDNNNFQGCKKWRERADEMAGSAIVVTEQTLLLLESGLKEKNQTLKKNLEKYFADDMQKASFNYPILRIYLPVNSINKKVTQTIVNHTTHDENFRETYKYLIMNIDEQTYNITFTKIESKNLFTD